VGFEIDVMLRRGAWQRRFRFASGEGITALCGPSGAGKSSVLEAIAGLLRPQSGRIAVQGNVLFDVDAKVNLPPERRACGFVFQDLRLFPHLSVKDNLRYGARRESAGGTLMDLAQTTRFLGIEHLLHRAPRTLSGGEAQRVALGRALLSATRFLLMDEPLSALDAPRRAEIMGLIERIRDELRLPILLVSHQRHEVERLASTVVDLEP
jgi:molybdate transport system ATP-binding protein